MCGIAGEIRFAPGPSAGDWDAISRLMQRRGPDDSGHWRDDHCTLAFRRLSILDLSPRGHQPMLDESGRCVLIFNGEVYNFREIRRDLESAGLGFRSSGDAEVVLKALMTWGHEALDRFNGIFALAFYDLRSRELLLARDHAGIKPLYFLEDARGVIFGSQFDQILAHPWNRRHDLSSDALALYLRFGYVPAPWAILQNSHMIEPGSWVRVDTEGRVRRGTWYRLPVRSEVRLTGEEADEAVDAAVAAAVKRQLVSDVPVGAFLSGGIDSPLIVAKMVAAKHDGLRAYTIGTDGAPTDESDDARRYAEALGVDQVLEQIRPEEALSLLPEVVTASSEPFGDHSIFPTMLVSRLASREFKVMLSGDGGDELFWGYAHRSGEVIRFASVFREPFDSRNATERVNGHALPAVARNSRDIGGWYLRRHTRLKHGWFERIFPDLAELPPAFRGYEFAGHDPGETAQWLRWNEFRHHLTMVLLKVDRASMQYSQEVRVPLLDREVIDTALQVDWRSCLDLDELLGKKPLRHSLARHVRHQTTAKRGFEAPMGDWLRGPLRSRFEDQVIAADTFLGFDFDRTQLEACYAEHLSGRRNYARALWPLLSLALWKEEHYDRRAA